MKRRVIPTLTVKVGLAELQVSLADVNAVPTSVGNGVSDVVLSKGLGEIDLMEENSGSAAGVTELIGATLDVKAVRKVESFDPALGLQPYAAGVVYAAILGEEVVGLTVEISIFHVSCWSMWSLGFMA